MLELDNRTLLVVTALVSIGSAIALILLWRSQSHRNGAGLWACGMSFVALASILISARNYIPDFISVIGANLFYVIGFLFILRGFRIFTKTAPLTFLDWSLISITGVLFYYYHYIDQNLNARIVVISSAFLIICSAIVLTLLRDKKVPWRSIGFLVATIYALFGILHGVRGIIAFTYPFESSFMGPSALTSLVFLAGIFLLGGSAIALILLTNATLESELRIVSLAVKQSASSIIITDTKGVIGFVNPAFMEKTGYSLEDIEGKTPRVLRSGDTPPEVYAELWKTLIAGKTWRGELHNRKKNGELFWEIASISPVKQKNGNVSHYVAIKEDITALKTAEQRILHMANHDVLTGLPTRRLGMDRLVNTLAIAKRNKVKLAVLFVDIDGFKMVNDTLGHDTGDLVLKEIATRLCLGVREVDTVARVGGDEFWVLLNDVTDKNAIIAVVEKLIKTLSTPYETERGTINISASIGIASYPEHGKSPQELIYMADQAMYKVKRLGKNNYAFAEKDSAES